MGGSLDFSRRASSISQETPTRGNQSVPSFHRVKTGHWAWRAQHLGPHGTRQAPLCSAMGDTVRLACCPARMCAQLRGLGPRADSEAGRSSSLWAPRHTAALRAAGEPAGEPPPQPRGLTPLPEGTLEPQAEAG